MKTDAYLKKVNKNKDIIINLSLSIQKKFNQSASKYLVIEPSDIALENQKSIELLNELDINSIYLWREKEVNNDSIIIYSTDYNPFFGNRKSITYCYGNCKMSEDYIKVTDRIYYRKHKKQF
ncbi:hypothetical protein [Psychroserpens luteus]|uniref:Uncharacterized protein n=1 Tax=Psychroserpens luteus TaxID=1434066 RepID=A0ABW5ZR66_9FLAO|nr:hypothetical protein [Psychroserpens luteus]